MSKLKDAVEYLIGKALLVEGRKYMNARTSRLALELDTDQLQLSDTDMVESALEASRNRVVKNIVALGLDSELANKYANELQQVVFDYADGEATAWAVHDTVDDILDLENLEVK